MSITLFYIFRMKHLDNKWKQNLVLITLFYIFRMKHLDNKWKKNTNELLKVCPTDDVNNFRLEKRLFDDYLPNVFLSKLSQCSNQGSNMALYQIFQAGKSWFWKNVKIRWYVQQRFYTRLYMLIINFIKLKFHCVTCVYQLWSHHGDVYLWYM